MHDCPMAERRVVHKTATFARSASSCGGWGREGGRTEAPAEQRLAPGGRAALPLTRTRTRRAAPPLTRTVSSDSDLGGYSPNPPRDDLHPLGVSHIRDP